MSADDRPAWVRLESWVRSVGTTTLPLLAGFFTTSVVVVTDGAHHFFAPGVTILLLTTASVSLILAVQRAYHVCMFLADGSSAGDDGANVWRLLRRTRRAYRIGVVLFLAGLAFAVAPQNWLLAYASLYRVSRCTSHRCPSWPLTCSHLMHPVRGIRWAAANHATASV